ncbi:MAG: VOC family protein [Thermoproteota archaeon]|nr:VOC family protein [Thermoproteota archaeon]
MRNKIGFTTRREKSDKEDAPNFYLQVDDVDTIYADLKGKGVKFVSKPKDQYWGSQTATFLDPDGNRFILLEIQK